MLPASGQLSYEPMIEQFSCDIVQLLPLYMFFWVGEGGGGSIANELVHIHIRFGSVIRHRIRVRVWRNCSCNDIYRAACGHLDIYTIC